MPQKNDEVREVWQVTVRLPFEVAERIKIVAAERLVPPAVLVRQLVKERIDQIAPLTPGAD